MPSSLLNAPHPDTNINRNILYRGSNAYQERAMKVRRHYLARAVKGDAEGRLFCRTYFRLTGWYSKEHGDVLGDLSKVAKEREGR